jgi:outer membrane protein assembly factor BamB
LVVFSQKEKTWSKPFRECWNYKSKQIVGEMVASDKVNNIIIFPNLSGLLTAINIKTGEVLWNMEIGGKLVTKPAFYADKVYILIEAFSSEIISSDEKNDLDHTFTLRSIDAITGLTRQAKIIPHAEQTFLFEKENKFIFLHADGGFAAIELEVGGILTEFKNKDWNLFPVSIVNLLGDILLIGTYNKEIFLVSSVDGSLLKKISVKDVPENISLDGRETLIWADRRGFVNALDLETNKLIWKKRSGAALSGIVPTSSGYLATSLDNFVYLLDRENGDVIWKKRFGSKLFDISLFNDDVAMVASFDNAFASLLDIKDGKLINIISLSDATEFLMAPLLINNGVVFFSQDGLFFYTPLFCDEK